MKIAAIGIFGFALVISFASYVTPDVPKQMALKRAEPTYGGVVTYFSVSAPAYIVIACTPIPVTATVTTTATSSSAYAVYVSAGIAP